ncbi:MAG TPA: hypothetical protein VK034_20825, partial [Enhygromyxa sp.]|nr:hypothetical protein [Enhygromyxa sp.]
GWGRDELARLDDPEVVEQLAASGCDELVIDFDTLGGPADSRPLVLGALVRQLQRRGFAIHGIFTLGQDHDDLGCFERLVEWVEAQRLVTVELRLWTPDPGSSLVRMLAREDRIPHRALDRRDGAHVVVAPKQMCAQALYRGWVWAQRRLDSLASIWRRRPRDRVGLLRYATTMIAAKLGSRERLLPAFTPARETSRPPSRPPRPLLLAPLASLARGLVDFDRRS